ncbi:hypothetical protein A4X06_0g739 [Tilletia controversa]|uniref:OPA3-like protein n=1 Tax=Tilletia controversa TaxID=13291 RepID=A0A8X7T0U5_9BASI|nr:hypothetical protein CF328_g5398 [Tilletia controversa]KAE8254792.1 hypothetical protein A4X06_0g739 [Tilletia controversa]
MASAKVATLAIRTLAKPIATQIKSQAADHPTFRAFCIGLAQVMHRVEMRARSNLLGANTEHQKIRPLSESKAIANGANAISEGFLFAVAAALIIGESFRSSRSNAKQRNRTEEAVEELRDSVKELAGMVGLSVEELEERRRVRREREAAEKEGGGGGGQIEGGGAGEEGQEAGTPSSDLSSSSSSSIAPPLSPRKELEQERLERERLQRAVQVLLQLALRRGWVQGQDALDLDAVMSGRDEEAKKKEENEGAGAGAGVGRRGVDGQGGEGMGVGERIAALGRSSVVVLPGNGSESSLSNAIAAAVAEQQPSFTSDSLPEQLS